MTKKLNTDAIKNELAESVFFRTSPQDGFGTYAGFLHAGGTDR